MLVDALKSIGEANEPEEGIAELVVTALGSSGQYYICWRTYSGEYKQKSHGLPRRLDDWLFPENGSTRDFATLQVILYSEDNFRASDENGEIRSDESTTRARFRRAITLSEGTAWLRKRSSGIRPESDAFHKRAISADRPRPLSMVSMLNNESGTHSYGGDFNGRNRLKEVEEQTGERLPPLITRTSSLKRRSGRYSNRSLSPATTVTDGFTEASSVCSCHRDSFYRGDFVPKRPQYADASVQTEVLVEGKEWDHDVGQHQKGEQFSRARPSTESHSHMEANAGGFIRHDGHETEHLTLVNPIVMGRMQDYFRGGGYSLGQALG